ncbi:MAG: hypothetical protein B7Z72_06510 [Gemmatimonadetes bacterium 21-71-4]|nr:MAG: hypothetical protein B7Z72_06510 [Gemmatimonadetes bacterium 21-71-4]
MNDERLTIRRAIQGDEAAMRSLWTRHAPHIDMVVRRLVGPDHDAAEDIAQEVWIQIFRALPTYRGDSQFATWAHRIAVNRTLNALRRTRRLSQVEIDMDETIQSPREAANAARASGGCTRTQGTGTCRTCLLSAWRRWLTTTPRRRSWRTSQRARCARRSAKRTARWWRWHPPNARASACRSRAGSRWARRCGPTDWPPRAPAPRRPGAAGPAVPGCRWRRRCCSWPAAPCSAATPPARRSCPAWAPPPRRRPSRSTPIRRRRCSIR